MEYYVYVGTLNGVVKYVGKGSGDRYLHLNSGVSSSYLANKSHFESNFLDVVIAQRFDNELEALRVEAELIESLRPEWNFYGAFGKAQSQPRGGKGVQFKRNKKTNPWYAYVHKDYKKIHVGYYPTEEEAIEARRVFLL